MPCGLSLKKRKSKTTVPCQQLSTSGASSTSQGAIEQDKHREINEFTEVNEVKKNVLNKLQELKRKKKSKSKDINELEELFGKYDQIVSNKIIADKKELLNVKNIHKKEIADLRKTKNKESEQWKKNFQSTKDDNESLSSEVNSLFVMPNTYTNNNIQQEASNREQSRNMFSDQNGSLQNEKSFTRTYQSTRYNEDINLAHENLPNRYEKLSTNVQEEQFHLKQVQQEKQELDTKLNSAMLLSKSLENELENVQSKCNEKDEAIRTAGIRIKELEMQVKKEVGKYNKLYQEFRSLEQTQEQRALSHSNIGSDLRNMKEKLNWTENRLKKLQFENDQKKFVEETNNTNKKREIIAPLFENLLEQLDDGLTVISETINEEDPITFDDVLKQEHDEYKKQCLKVLNSISMELDNYEDDIRQFRGTKTDKTYLHVQEMLHRCVSRLDNMQNMRGDKALKEQRRMLIMRINKLDRNLENKIN